MNILKKLVLLFAVCSASCAYATDYYLDVDAIGSGSGLSMSDAFTSFDAVALSPFGSGDTLYISGGSTSKTYYLTATYTIPSDDMTLRVSPEEGHNGVVVIDGGDAIGILIHLSTRSGTTIDGEINGERHIRLQNWGGQGAGEESTAIKSHTVTGITLRYIESINDDTTCTLTDCTDIELKGGWRLTNTGGNSLIEHNYFEGCIRFALVAGGGSSGFEETIIQYNESKGFRNESGQGGPDGLKGLGHSTVRYNKVYLEELPNAEYNKDHGAEDGIQAVSSYVKIYGNEVYGYSLSAVRTDPLELDNVYIYNNLLYANGIYGVQRGIQLDIVNSATNTHIYNNTIVGFKFLGIDIMSRDETTVSDVKVYNNIVVDAPLSVDSISLALGTDIDYNLCLNEDYSHNGCSVAQTHEPYDSGKSFAFTSYTLGATDNDFHLANTDNMAIGSGVDLSGYFIDDFSGASRTVWSLGAYVYNGTITTQPPPTSLFQFGGGTYILKLGE